MATRLNIRRLRSFIGLVAGVGTLLTCAQGARGQVTYELLHVEGSNPTSPLTQASDGNFYGTTAGGGTAGVGTVFKITGAGALSTLHSFDGLEGFSPQAGLIQASDGHFYGTTLDGGTTRGGTVFKITAAGTLTTLYSFACPTEGCAPFAGLIQGSDGNFYGTTAAGGAAGGGTVFKITAAGALTRLHSFDCSVEGCLPEGAGLIQDSDGNFYGTTTAGGVFGGGTVFTITAAGTFATLHSFDCSTGGCGPEAGVIQGSDGKFYGTTRGGFRGATVFTITAAGTVTTLQSIDGCFPRGLIQASDGNFYGTTDGRDCSSVGTVFRITAAGTFTTLHSFDCATEGCAPQAGLIEASGGNFYGTTGGGGGGGGTIFTITSGGTLTTLHSFGGGSLTPSTGLIQASDGNFYGTKRTGGATGGGTVFKITAAGALTTLHSFDCSPEGCFPEAGLIQGSDGNFYGTTTAGGVFGGGTVFTITTAGTLTTLHSFDCSSEGCLPAGAGLIEATDGNFYGTTLSGGADGGGAVFKITATGTLTTLHSFVCSTDGCGPFAGVIQASDGKFYGTTREGGAFGGGTLFRITAAGAFTTLQSFDCPTEGCAPYAGLIQASDGNFYGMTTAGGAAGSGTVFKFEITSTGASTTLHSFDCSTEGCNPFGGLIQGSDGNFYGTTTAGGAAGSGTVFKMTVAGTLTTLHSFDCSTEGCNPFGGLIEASDGNLYGTALDSSGGGVIFRLVGRLSALGPASIWIGLRNSDDVGLRLDVLAEVFVDRTKVGEGRLNNVSAGSSGFSKAVLRAVPLDLTGGPLDFSVVVTIEVKVSVRRTCSGGGHASGTARLWYNGQPIDSGAKRDAGGRVDVISGGATTSNFLRAGFALSTAPGTSRQSIDVSVDSKQPCPNRTFKAFGTWSNNP